MTRQGRIHDGAPSGAVAILLTLLMLGFAVASDYLLDVRPLFPRTAWAAYDNIVHGVIAGLICGMMGRGQRAVILFGCGYLIGAGLDIDHAIAARSLSIDAMLAIGPRPFTHSLTFAAGAAVVAGVTSKRLLVGWIVFAALASHVVRDAGLSVTPILWPAQPMKIAAPAYYAALAVLAMASWWIARCRSHA